MAGSGTAHLRGPDVMLSVEHLVVEFGRGRNRVHAVSDVSLDVAAGETLGLVGESGCGKSTTGRAIAMVNPPTAGNVRLDGVDLTAIDKGQLRQVRTKVQLVFQDPISSLNPRRKVRDVVAEPLNIWRIGTRAERTARVAQMLEAVGIDPASGDRHPVEFSGGQCQRVSIARALMLEPKLLICDEPVSALDVSVQAQILNLLEDIKAADGSHDDLHRPRPRRREARERPRRGDVPGEALRARAARRPVPPASSSVHRSLDRLDPGARSDAWGPQGSQAPFRRPSVPDQPAIRVPLPDPLPLRPGPLCGRGASDEGARTGSIRGLSLPDRRTGRSLPTGLTRCPHTLSTAPDGTQSPPATGGAGPSAA